MYVETSFDYGWKITRMAAALVARVGSVTNAAQPLEIVVLVAMKAWYASHAKQNSNGKEKSKKNTSLVSDGRPCQCMTN